MVQSRSHMGRTLRYSLQVLAGIGLWAVFDFTWIWWSVFRLGLISGYTYYYPLTSLGDNVPSSTFFVSFHFPLFLVIAFVLSQLISYLAMRNFLRQFAKPE